MSPHPIDLPKPPCPHCEAQPRAIELQHAKWDREVYFCTSCSRTFTILKSTGEVLRG